MPPIACTRVRGSLKGALASKKGKGCPSHKSARLRLKLPVVETTSGPSKRGWSTPILIGCYPRTDHEKHAKAAGKTVEVPVTAAMS